MKALLVIDMPKDCWDCHLVDEWGNCNAIKITSERYGVSVKQYDKERPLWCPLKPLNKIVKAGDRNLIIYERKWLYEHLEEEFELQKKVRDFDESHISD